MSILIVSEDPALEAVVRDAAGQSVPIRTVPMRTSARAAHADLAVVVIDGVADLEAALDVAQDFDDLRPDVTVVLHASPDASVVGRAMQAGIRDVLPPDANDERIRESLKRALEVADRRQALRGDTGGIGNRLIMVMSPKGGAGKTTMASNFAVGLASRLPRQVVLVDGDLQFGDVANSLRLLAETTIRDAIAGGLQDVTEVKVHLTPHRSGLFALCAPDVPGVADEITTQAFTKAVTMLAAEFPYVVVDTDPGLGERTLTVMDHATDLIFVAATDVASVRGLHKTIDALDRIGMTDQTRHFVLNRADAKVGLEIADIVETIGMEPDVLVPSHRDFPISMNQGTPILEDPSNGTPAADALWQLVDRFLPADHHEDHGARRGGLLRRRGER